MIRAEPGVLTVAQPGINNEKTMINQQERMTAHLSKFDFVLVRQAFIDRSRLENKRIADTRAWMLDNGFELLENIADDQYLTDDGREILRAHGKTWALLPEIHTQRQERAMDMERQRLARSKEPVTKSVVGTEKLANIVCPRCQEAMEHSTVCPNCAAGKTGFKHRYTCHECGAELVTREGL